MFDLSNYEIIRVAGKDRLAFLEKVTTAELGIIAEDDGVSTLFLNEEGLIIGHAHLVVEKNSFLLIVDPIYNLWEYLKGIKEKLFSGSEVELALDMKTIAVIIQGPQTVTIFRDVLNQDILYLRCGSCHYCVHNEIPICLLRVVVI